MQNMYYFGLDVHKRTISYCVKDGSRSLFSATGPKSERARGPFGERCFTGNPRSRATLSS